MGVMINGVWHAEEPKQDDKDGRWQRARSPLRSWITARRRSRAIGR